MKQVVLISFAVSFLASPVATTLAEPGGGAGTSGDAGASGQTAGCTTSGCHSRIREFQSLHKPVASGQCVACHKPKPEATPYQPGLRHEFNRAGDNAAACFTCHDRAAYTAASAGGNLKFAHKPTETGVCILCHDPHGADGPNLLRVEVDRQLCYRCHRVTFDKGEHVHPPVGDGLCLACHNPHGSDQEKFLRAAVPELCLDCHDGIEDLLEDATGVHGAVLSGRSCIGCHNPHAGTFSALLTEPNPSGTYFPYKVEAYAMCLDCHDEDMVEVEDDPDVTGFRNGDVNLHYMHVNRQEKGSTCVVCHNPHAGKGTPHMADASVLEDKAVLTEYDATKTGGTCLSKCHAKRGYDRVKPVQNP